MNPEEILGPDDLVPLETLLSHLIVKTTSNEQLSQAESLLNSCIQTDPNRLARKLGNLLGNTHGFHIILENEAHSRRLAARAMAPLLLRDLFNQNGPQNLPATLVQLMNWAVLNEQNKPIIKILAATISKLAADYNGLPEDVTDMLLDLLEANDSKVHEPALLIVVELAQDVGDSLVPHKKRLHDAFKERLRNVGSADEVYIIPTPDNKEKIKEKIAALSATLSAPLNFILCLKSSSDRDMFQDLLPDMSAALSAAIHLIMCLKSLNSSSDRFMSNGREEAMVQKVLVLLVELAGTKPLFFRGQLVEVVGSMLLIAKPKVENIAEAENLEEGTRHLAIKFVIKLAEAKELTPEMMRELSEFIDRLFAILMTMLSDIKDEAAWHSAENKDEDESSNYSVAKEFLHRLVTKLGGDTIVLVVCEQLSAYLAALEWQKRLAGLVALAQIAKGRSKVTIPNLEQVVTRVLNSFQDPDHLSVKWAAINAIGRLSAYVGPPLLSQHHDRVLPALASALTDISQHHDRVLPALASALTDIHSPRVQYLRLMLRALAEAILSDNPDPYSHRASPAAINETGQFFTDLDPDLQSKYHRLVLPEGLRYGFHYQQVEERAASVMIHTYNKNLPNAVTHKLLKIAANLLKGPKVVKCIVAAYILSFPG